LWEYLAFAKRAIQNSEPKILNSDAQNGIGKTDRTLMIVKHHIKELHENTIGIFRPLTMLK
jgi:hypothetical protein